MLWNLGYDPAVLHLKLWHLTHTDEFLRICSGFPLPVPLAYNLTKVPLRDALREVITSGVKRPNWFGNFVNEYVNLYPELGDFQKLSLDDLFIDNYINQQHKENIGSLPSPVLLSPHEKGRLAAFEELLVRLKREDIRQMFFLLGLHWYHALPGNLAWSDISLWSDKLLAETRNKFKQRHPPETSDPETYTERMGKYIDARKKIYTPPTPKELRATLRGCGVENAFYLDEDDLAEAEMRVMAERFIKSTQHYFERSDQIDLFQTHIERAYLFL